MASNEWSNNKKLIDGGAKNFDEEDRQNVLQI